MKLNLKDQSQIQLVQIFARFPGERSQSLVGIIFADQINKGVIDFKFSKAFPAGTYINSLYFTDKSQNTSALVRGSQGDLVYSFKQLGSKIVKTNYNVIGW